MKKRIICHSRESGNPEKDEQKNWIPDRVGNDKLLGRDVTWGHLLILFLVLVFLTLGGIKSAFSQTTLAATENQIKAAYIYYFLEFVKWPENTNTLIIGVLGDDEFYPVMEKIVRGKTMFDKDIVVKRLTQIEEALQVNVLFIGPSQYSNLPSILTILGRSAVLTIGDEKGFAARGVMINFVVEGEYVRFEVNPDAVKRTKLKVSSQLLKLGRKE
jgi:hypothetical protein